MPDLKAKPFTVANTRIVVSGTSAGGLETLISLVRQLPEEIPAAVFVVMHMAATSCA